MRSALFTLLGLSGGLERHRELADALLHFWEPIGSGRPRAGVQPRWGEPPRIWQVLRRHDLCLGLSLTRMEEEKDSSRSHRAELTWSENKPASSQNSSFGGLGQMSKTCPQEGKLLP